MSLFIFPLTNQKVDSIIAISIRIVGEEKMRARTKPALLNEIREHRVITDEAVTSVLIEKLYRWVEQEEGDLKNLSEGYAYHVGYYAPDVYSVQLWRKVFDMIYHLERNLYCTTEHYLNDESTVIVKIP